MPVSSDRTLDLIHHSTMLERKAERWQLNRYILRSPGSSKCSVLVHNSLGHRFSASFHPLLAKFHGRLYWKVFHGLD